MSQPSVVQSMLDTFQECDIDWLVVVPGSGLNAIYSYYSERDRCIYATREEEAIAIATGLTLGGEFPLVLMQQSGVGNSLNAVFTLAEAYEVFFPIVVCDRSANDPNLIQQVSSFYTARVLQELDSVEIDWRDPDAVTAFQAMLQRRQRWIVCTLVGQP